MGAVSSCPGAVWSGKGGSRNGAAEPVAVRGSELPPACVPPGPSAPPHLTDLPTAAGPDCLPFFHIICVATACIGILIIPSSFCRVTLPWEVRWRSSAWPATGERQLAWRGEPQRNKNRHFSTRQTFLSEGCRGLTPASSSEARSCLLCVSEKWMH